MNFFPVKRIIVMSKLQKNFALIVFGFYDLLMHVLHANCQQENLHAQTTLRLDGEPALVEVKIFP